MKVNDQGKIRQDFEFHTCIHIESKNKLAKISFILLFLFIFS